uniref:Uncharacterized protein n=1 Tax=Aureoumbra lagunensis TaxID=44058 RepID=A0A7S3JYQ4_9STRA|mmetsp:Transcript_3431/g.4805  ORF Transcript_3431/g.4805 Transcript_3431/m.4805 type:complete len:287 (-) Transcript_3431:53-913(-)
MEVDDERYDEVLVKTTFIDEFRCAVSEIGCVSMSFSAMIAVAATAYALIFHPKYQKKRAPLPNIEIRYVPSAVEQLQMRNNWNFVQSSVDFSTKNDNSSTKIIFGHTHSGHHRLPRFFYESASFGLASNDLNLWSALYTLNDPKPSLVLPWTYQYANTNNAGIFVSFPFNSTNKQDSAIDRLLRIQNGAKQNDWHHAQTAIETIARKANLSLILSWTPNHFGSTHHSDDLRHAHILQQILPLRSGFQNLRSASAVWANSPLVANLSIISSHTIATIVDHYGTLRSA